MISGYADSTNRNCPVQMRRQENRKRRTNGRSPQHVQQQTLTDEIEAFLQEQQTKARTTIEEIPMKELHSHFPDTYDDDAPT